MPSRPHVGHRSLAENLSLALMPLYGTCCVRRPRFGSSVSKWPTTRKPRRFEGGAHSISNTILQEAGSLKLQSLIRKEIEKEFAQPSDEFVKLIAGRVHEGRITPAVKENFAKLLSGSISTLVREMVTDRLSSALHASSPEDDETSSQENEAEKVLTTEEEVSGYRIIQAIASKLVNPKRVVIRDAKSYCAVLLDDNNRKTVARLHFDAVTKKNLGLFSGRDETKYLVAEPADIYRFMPQIEARLRELDGSPAPTTD